MGHTLQINYAHRYYVRCNRNIGWQSGTKNNEVIHIYSSSGLSHKIVYRPHSSIRALRAYDFWVIAQNSTAKLLTREHRITDGY